MRPVSPLGLLFVSARESLSWVCDCCAGHPFWIPHPKSCPFTYIHEKLPLQCYRRSESMQIWVGKKTSFEFSSKRITTALLLATMIMDASILHMRFRNPFSNDGLYTVVSLKGYALPSALKTSQCNMALYMAKYVSPHKRHYSAKL